MKRLNRCAILPTLCVAATLSACGGGGGAGGGGGTSSYTVAGTITGLTASGLVLLDNDGNALDVAANATSFQFGTALANGAAYAVTVQTQPSGETCSVSNGSGTITSANVTNVSVSCGASATYTVGGSITGLTGSGLVLLDNGGNALDVPANATSFQFGTALANGAAYAVAVQIQPSGETCSVSNGSGTITSANVTNVSVSCGASATYTVGGSITGLTGSGLVLLDNGGNALGVPANATSFQFGTALANGAAYAVAVQIQPSGETCSVSNGSGTITSAHVTNVSVSCSFSGSGSNVVTLSVNPGPASSGNQTFNDLLASVTVCQPNTQTCVTINNVLVDTGSEGLRLMKSALTSAGLALAPLADPNIPANTIHECLPFADGYTWGAVALAGLQLGGESAASVPVQIIDDSAVPSPAAPASCTSNGMSLNSVNAFDADGVLGVGLFVQDCGQACVSSASPDIYYSCTGAGSCSSSTLVLADQVANPVASFATDNNGVIVQLPAIPATGAQTAAGYLVFGIGTQTNNGLAGGATVVQTNGSGYFTTTFNGQALNGSFIDSGSNALFFPDSSISTCPDAAEFYCPGSASALSTQNLMAPDQGTNGTISNVSFQIANLDYLSANDGNNYALDDVGGPAAGLKGISNYFDWGMPFFYGRTVYFAIDGMPAPPASGNVGPYYAF